MPFISFKSERNSTFTFIRIPLLMISHSLPFQLACFSGSDRSLTPVAHQGRGGFGRRCSLLYSSLSQPWFTMEPFLVQDCRAWPVSLCQMPVAKLAGQMMIACDGAITYGIVRLQSAWAKAWCLALNTGDLWNKKPASGVSMKSDTCRAGISTASNAGWALKAGTVRLRDG
jgi:hypothetical protein